MKDACLLIEMVYPEYGFALKYMILFHAVKRLQRDKTINLVSTQYVARYSLLLMRNVIIATKWSNVKF